MRRSAPVVCVPAVGDRAVGVFGVKGVGVGGALAVVFDSGGTFGAVGEEAGEGLGADADAVADSVTLAVSEYVSRIWGAI